MNEGMNQRMKLHLSSDHTIKDAVLDFKSDLEAEFEKVKKLLKEVEEMTNGAKPTADTIPATEKPTNGAKPTADAIPTTAKPLQLFTSGGDDNNDNKNNENTNPATTATPAPTEPKPKEITIPLERNVNKGGQRRLALVSVSHRRSASVSVGQRRLALVSVG